MAVFMDTGNEDIYAAETREECVKAILADSPSLAQKQHEFFEVGGSMLMRTENEDGSAGPISTLAEEYTNLGYGYCIASTNC
jgi:hypothetical protein